MSKFLDTNDIEVRETVPASRRLNDKDAAELVREAKRVIVAKGKKLDEFEGGQARKPVVDAMLGPTGNLRSPTIKVGKTIVVGFNEDALRDVLL